MTAERSVVLLARALEVGGAERQMVTLAQGLHAAGVAVTVVVLYGPGPLGEELLEGGIPVVTVGKRGRWDLLGFSLRYWRAIRGLRPRIIHSYHVVPNLIALAGKPFFPGVEVVLGLRTNTAGDGDDDLFTRMTFRVAAALSFLADKIIANSRSGAEFHIRHGYPAARMHVVPNAIDTDRFRPDPEAPARFRRELGIPADAPLVGMVKRFVPYKDHATFLEACALLQQRLPGAHFILIGDGMPALIQRLKAQAAALGLSGRLHWVGKRTDMPAVFSALTVHVSTSRSEGFPNVLGEAMACGCPCISTPVGDSAEILGPFGRIVPFGDAPAVATAVEAEIAARTPDTDAARRRTIVERFGRAQLVRRTREVLGV